MFFILKSLGRNILSVLESMRIRVLPFDDLA